MFSERVSIHFTGRPSFRAAAATTISSERAPAFAPNPPPMSPTTTRMSAGDMSSDDAISARSPNGTWLVARTRRRPPSGTTGSPPAPSAPAPGADYESAPNLDVGAGQDVFLATGVEMARNVGAMFG